MLRSIIAALAALLPTALIAQEEVIAVTETPQTTIVYDSAMRHNAMHTAACSTCHVSDGAMMGGLDLEYADAQVIPAPSAIRLGEVTFVPLASDLVRSHLPLEKEAALMVSATASESDLVKPGDVILTVNAVPVSDHEKIQSSVESDRSKPAQILLIRGGKRMEAEVPGGLFARPEQPYLIGVQVEAPSDALRSQLSLYENEGLLITEVVEDSPAQKAGFQQHDILLRAGEQRISTLDDLRACVTASKGEAIELTFMRGGKEQKLSATPERKETPEAIVDVYRVCPRMSTMNLQLLNQHGEARYFFAPGARLTRPTPAPEEKKPESDD